MNRKIGKLEVKGDNITLSLAKGSWAWVKNKAGTGVWAAATGYFPGTAGRITVRFVISAPQNTEMNNLVLKTDPLTSLTKEELIKLLREKT